MQRMSTIKSLVILGACWGIGAVASVASVMVHAAGSSATSTPAAAPAPADASPSSAVSSRAATAARTPLDRTGRTRVGVASFYADRYAGRKMADGTPMRPESNNAASITLPLGTTARVTNLETGRSAVVVIQDRGPYVKGRIVDLSPATARLIGLARSKGLARVAVSPIAVPLADGTFNTSAARMAMNR